MNYLSHFALNHDVLRLPVEPHFVAGVMLPDLWSRVSRRRRIRWSAVRAAVPRDEPTAALRAGLLNHVAADAAFHLSPVFLKWQAQVRRTLDVAAGAPRDETLGGMSALSDGDGAPAAPSGSVLDFLAHVAIELALDRQLLCARGDLASSFYEALEWCDPQAIEQTMRTLGDVDARGLARELSAFRQRRFLERMTDPAALVLVMQFVFSLIDLPAAPTEGLIRVALSAAQACADPDAVWRDLLQAQTLRRTPRALPA